MGDKAEILKLKKLLADEKEERKKVQQEMQELKRLWQINAEQPTLMESAATQAEANATPEAHAEQAPVVAPAQPSTGVPVQQPTGEQKGNGDSGNINSSSSNCNYFMPFINDAPPTDRRQVQGQLFHRLVRME